MKIKQKCDTNKKESQIFNFTNSKFMGLVQQLFKDALINISI